MAKYTAAQKAAFKSGVAYKLGKEGRVIKFKNDKNKASFTAGYKNAKVDKYPKKASKSK